MTQTQYLKALKRLKLTTAGKATAAILGVTLRQVQRYAAGARIPGPIALLLAMYLKHGLPPVKERAQG